MSITLRQSPPPAGRWAAYRRGALPDDLIAAAIVTVLLVPQSLAYAMLAGLPPVVGVVASLLPVIAYAAFGSSTSLAVGPVAVLAMMTAQAVLPVAAEHGVAPTLAAQVLALEMAAVFALAVLLRLEVFAALLSAPVLHGFVTGAALVIAVGQLSPLLGLKAGGQTLIDWAPALARHGALPHAATAAIGLSALLALWALRRHGAALLQRLGWPQRRAQLAARIAPIGVVAGAIALAAGAPGWVDGVAMAGRVDLRDALQVVPPWHAPWALWVALAAPAALLGLVAYVESLAVAEALAARRAEKIAPRRELLGLAAANAAAGLSGGMPVTGGFARSIVAFDAGARTRMAGVWTALFLAIAVLLLGSALARLPKAVLAATIIVAVLSLVDREPFVQAWRGARREFVLMVAVAATTLLAGVEPALALGVLGSIALLLQRSARPHWAEVGRLPGTEIFRNVRRHAVETLPDVLALRIDESLQFTNARWLAQTVLDTAADRPALRHVVLMMSGVNDVDLTGVEMLQTLQRELRALGVQLHLSELKGPVHDRLQAAGLGDWLDGRLFRTQAEAHRALSAPDEPALVI